MSGAAWKDIAPTRLIEDDPEGHWSERALCAQTDPDGYYPDKGQAPAAVKKVCRSCPVREQCLEAGMDEPFGVWGGLSERERRALRRRAA